jgi:hypothetical protein
MPSVKLFERGLKFGGQDGGLEPSSNQAGSGAQFKLGESIAAGGAAVPKTSEAVEKLGSDPGFSVCASCHLC